MGRRVPILTYHSLDESGSPISLDPEAFRAQIGDLRRRGFRGVALREVLDAWQAGREAPARAVALTFDDGFRSVADVAVPVLKEAGFGATFFAVAGRALCNAWPGQASGIPLLPLLSATELRRLADEGFEIGGHGVTHTRLDRLRAAEAERELADCKRMLEDAIAGQVTVFAYPYGRSSAALRSQAAAHYRAACTDELRVATASDDRYALGRVDMYYFRRPLAWRRLGTPWGDALLELRRLGRRLRATGRMAFGSSR